MGLKTKVAFYRIEKNKIILLNEQIKICYFPFQGRLEDRKPLLILFSEDAMDIIFTAAV